MTKFTKYGLGTIFLLLILLGFQNCSPASNPSVAGPSAANEITTAVQSVALVGKSSEYNPHHCGQTGAQCFKESFLQPVTNTNAVDVLFVVQTSASLSAARQAIVAGINGFITSLPAGSNFNIAVMLAHGSTSSWSGRLYQAGSEPIVLKSSELSAGQIQTDLDLKLNQVVMDPDSGGGEEGLFSLYNSLANSSLLGDAQTQDFFRPEAALGVVFVADQWDICAVLPAGVPPETDPLKIAARDRDCEGLTSAGLTARLKALKGSQPLAVSGIINVDSPAPAGEEIGYGYTDMISLNAGVAIDISHDDIAEGLHTIAELSGQQMSVQNEFILDYTGVDPKRITVTVNGVAVPFTVDANKVTVTSSIPSGAMVVVSYCLQAKPNTQGCHHRLHRCGGDGKGGPECKKKHKNCKN